MDKVLANSQRFTLMKRNKGDKKWYEIEYVGGWQFDFPTGEDQDVRNFFDPFRNKGGKYGVKWKYKNRKDAEQMYMMAVLKWS